MLGEVFINKVNSQNKHILTWLKVLTSTAFYQCIIQIINILIGIVIVRNLPTEQYAYYTIVNSVLGIIAVLADGGISSSIMAQAGQSWGNKDKVYLTIDYGIRLRKKMSWISLLFTLPLLVILLKNNKADNINVIIVILSAIPSFFSSISDVMLEIYPKLNQDFRLLQKNQLYVSLLRLIFAVISAITFPFTGLFLLANGIPRVLGNLLLKKYLKIFFGDLKETYLEKEFDTQQIKNKIIVIIKKVLPGSIYYCFSGQITIFLLSIYGYTSSVAEIGALNRVSVLVTVLSMVFSIIFIPKFAKENASRVMNLFLKMHVISILLALSVIFFVYIFSGVILKFLGNNYENLDKELVLSVVGSSIGLIGGFSYSLGLVRGWLISPFISIPINFSSLVLGMYIYDFTTLEGVLLFNIFVLSVQYFQNTFYLIKQINSD